MIIDAHAHLEQRMLDVDRMLQKLDAAHVDKVVLIPTMNDLLPETPERLLSVMRKAMRSGPGRLASEGIHRALLTPEGDLKLSGQVIRIYARPDNDAVVEVIRKHPQRFLGWIFLNPRNNPNVLEELERYRSEPGMIGVKLHPHWHDYRTDLLDPLLRRVEELGLPVLIHLGFRKRGDYRAIVERFPRLRVIAAHAGFPFYDALWSFGKAHRNLYVDLSSPYIDEPLARDAVRALGAERCIYGTDAPYGFHTDDHSYDYGRIRSWVERMPISSRDCDRILAANFAELID